MEKKDDETPIDPMVPTSDRQENLKAMTVAFLAENSLPLTMSSKLIEFAKVRKKKIYIYIIINIYSNIRT